VFSNNTIWFTHKRLDKKSISPKSIPRNWNAFGAGLPSLRVSNAITVETNVAMRGVDRRVAGLFARDETEKTVLLHNGKIGGGQEGVGKKAFMKWYSKRYPGRMTIFSDPSCDDDKKEAAILVAELDSPEFVSQIESFVDDVRRFKDAVRGLNDDLGEMSESDLGEKVAAARKKPKSSIAAVIVHDRNPYVAKLAKRRAGGKCELCGKPAPFRNSLDEPYLECHHIVWLAHGGSDRSENTVALCPNCHRKMHVLKDPKDIRTLRRRAKRAICG